MKILFAGETFYKLTEWLGSIFEGHDIELCPKDSIMEYVEGVDVIIPPSQIVDEKIIEKAGKKLKLIQMWGVGIEGIDIEAASKRGVYVCKVPSGGTGNAESVSEASVMLMLALARKLPAAIGNIASKKLWSPQGKSLWKKTAAVIGLGGVGKAIVQRLKCFGMNIIGVNRSFDDSIKDLALDEFIYISEMEKALTKADFVILALVLNSETRNIFSYSHFESMKRTAFIINIARAGLIDKEALLQALREESIAGAGLDVFWKEPPDPSDELFSFENVIATPHIAGVTDESLKGIALFVAENIKRISSGLTPEGCVNLQRAKL